MRAYIVATIVGMIILVACKKKKDDPPLIVGTDWVNNPVCPIENSRITEVIQETTYFTYKTNYDYDNVNRIVAIRWKNISDTIESKYRFFYLGDTAILRVYEPWVGGMDSTIEKLDGEGKLVEWRGLIDGWPAKTVYYYNNLGQLTSLSAYQSAATSTFTRTDTSIYTWENDNLVKIESQRFGIATFEYYENSDGRFLFNRPFPESVLQYVPYAREVKSKNFLKRIKGPDSSDEQEVYFDSNGRPNHMYKQSTSPIEVSTSKVYFKYKCI